MDYYCHVYCDIWNNQLSSVQIRLLFFHGKNSKEKNEGIIFVLTANLIEYTYSTIKLTFLALFVLFIKLQILLVYVINIFKEKDILNWVHHRFQSPLPLIELRNSVGNKKHFPARLIDTSDSQVKMSTPTKFSTHPSFLTPPLVPSSPPHNQPLPFFRRR